MLYHCGCLRFKMERHVKILSEFRDRPSSPQVHDKFTTHSPAYGGLVRDSENAENP
jgi:hypothetical protein